MFASRPAHSQNLFGSLVGNVTDPSGAAIPEATIIYLLSIGSPTHAIKPESWYAWERPENVYGDYKFIGTSPLFSHQYSHAFVDYRGRRENQGQKIAWFENSVTATKAHRQFCIDLAKEFPGYSENIWCRAQGNEAEVR